MVFVDCLTLTSLVGVWRCGSQVERLWHFEPLQPWRRTLLTALRVLGIVRATPEQVRHHVGQVKTDDGASRYVEMLHQARAICSAMRNLEIAHDPLINALGSLWPVRTLIFYVEKASEDEVRLECLRIGLVAWMLRTQLHIDPSHGALLIARRPWHPHLEALARSAGGGLTVAAYPDFGALASVPRACGRLLEVCGMRLGRGLRELCARASALTATRRHGTRAWASRAGPPEPRIAVRYGHRTLRVEAAARSEFFWLPASGIPGSATLLYDVAADPPIDEDTLRTIQRRGITVLGRGPAVPAWSRTWRFPVTLCRTGWKVLWAIARCLARGRTISLYVAQRLLRLTAEYAQWYDFFRAQRVKVHVGTLHTSVAQVLALEALHGVTIAYQYSISNILCPTTMLSAGESVQCVFSPLFERLWRSVGAPVDRYLWTGCLDDNADHRAVGRARADTIRKDLHDHGARFIICFFDENSVNRWDISAPDEQAADDYDYLLQWLLSDPTLGMVFKPKRFDTLCRRIAPLADVVEQAGQTGRCVFLPSETPVSPVYPAHAAMAADVCIGKLEGASAALEARLAGVPTLLVDAEGFRTHPFHQWGKGSVVFDDWPSLRAAVERYRASPHAQPGFGDWTPGLDDLDPFRDGQAARRLGRYIGWVYAALKDGAAPDAAVAAASERYARQWDPIPRGRVVEGSPQAPRAMAEVSRDG